MRGYFGIGIYQCKTTVNIGTLWRSAHNFNAKFIFTIGRRYHKQASDTTKAWRTVPLFEFLSMDDFYKHLPYDCELVGIEQCERAKNLATVNHPERAIYILGAEDHGLSPEIINRCHRVIFIETPMCLNVATAGSIVMYDRFSKQNPVSSRAIRQI